MNEKDKTNIALYRAQVEALKKQLADIKYLNADEVRQILLTVDLSATGREHLPKITRALDAICKLAIPDIDREKIIEVLNRFLFTDTDNPLEIVSGTATVLTSTGTIADEIIKALEGK